MMKRCVLPGLIAALLIASYSAQSQYPAYYQYSLLPSAGLTGLIAGESSGERAWQHISDMAGYARLRPLAEFGGDLMETSYLMEKLSEYGIGTARVDRFGTTRSWQGVSASLWEVAPFVRKIADLVESPLMLASGSASVDTVAELFYADAGALAAGLGRAEVSGKIIITPERPGAVLQRATGAGALAVISYYSPRPFESSIMIPATSAGGRGASSAGTVFMISPRDGDLLAKRVQSGERIRIRAAARAVTVDAELQVISCVIEGTDPMAAEVLITAHVFEGYVKTGGNDNISGSAAILESARTLNTLIENGSLPRPQRSIRFLWIPEFSGTIPWVAANRAIIDRTLCNVNLDMVGLSLFKWKSFFVLHRTSYGNAHYVGDIVENLFRYTGETNKVNSVVSGSRFFNPLVAPTGTDDPFLYQIESASGGSDHMVFNDLGVMVPGIMMITWPDPFYHTSEDLAGKCDPTQLRRTAFITSAAAWMIASAGPEEAVAIAGEVAANGIRRLGVAHSVASAMLAAEPDTEINTRAAYLTGRIRGTALGEAMILNSIRELAPGNKMLISQIENHISALNRIADEQAKMIAAQATAINSAAGKAAFSYRLNEAEKTAAAIKPVLTISTRDLGYRAYQNVNSKLPQEEMGSFNIRDIADVQEAIKLANGKNSLLDIKYILDSQYGRETTLTALTGYFSLLKKTGIVTF